ncbi:MAG: DUF202 domain-containing protein [Planctomycetota bacterium]
MANPPSPVENVRDQLALTRTQLANERTMLAYVRTAIMLAVTGATLLKLYADTMQNQVAGWSLIVASLAVVTLGAWRFRQLARQLT